MSNAVVLTLITFVVMALIKKKKMRKRSSFKRNRRVWCRKWLMRRDIGGKDIQSLTFDELVPEDPKSFQNFTRMSFATFNKLLNMVSPLITRQDTQLRQAIPAKVRLDKIIYFVYSTNYKLNFLPDCF